MFYYLIHNIIHWGQTEESMAKKDYPHTQKNTLTFIFGSIAWIFLLSFLRYPAYNTFISGSFILDTFKSWFSWFVLTDIRTKTRNSQSTIGAKVCPYRGT